MRLPKIQPSLSRDFAVLSLAVLFVLCVISAIVTYNTYTRNALRVENDMSAESLHVQHLLENELSNVNYLLTSLCKLIVLDDHHDLTRMAQILKSFDNHDYLYTILTWVNTKHEMVISSDQGIRENPIDMSDRDYIIPTTSEPWKMIIGHPVQGRASKRWIIPVGMGITDNTGKFIGSVVISIDILTLDKRISGLINHEGTSFAIANKEFVPLTHLSDSPATDASSDFISRQFSPEKLVNLNFTKTPNGLISQAPPWSDSSDYSYYRVMQNYPYVILLNYDSHYSNEPVLGLLWSRLLQMGGLALFFVLFLWIVRVHLIRPVIGMTDIVAGIANGKSYQFAGKKGPVELEALSMQVGRVSKYIEETKRIEGELRHKMFQMKQSRLEMQAHERSNAEFMATICQAMHTPLNSIIGGAQVMKDQIYGPIENRKYRQYASETYDIGNQLLATVQDMQALSKAETGYLALEEKPVDVEVVVNKAVRFVADKLQTSGRSLKLALQEPMPTLVADEFRLQQILMNLILYAVANTPASTPLRLEARVVTEKRDRKFFAFIVSQEEAPVASEPQLLSLATEEETTTLDAESPDVGIALAGSLVRAHQGKFYLKHTETGLALTAFFSGGRTRFSDAHGA